MAEEKYWTEPKFGFSMTNDLITFCNGSVWNSKYYRVASIIKDYGFGTAVIALLKKTSVKRNLFYEFKEKITEEYANNGVNTIKKKKLQKVYGLDSSKNVRDLLIGLLRERMEHHKDKFISKLLYNEFLGLEVKRDGKVDHSSNTHDDLTFSYLMALYVWYEGKDLKERYGITKQTLKTDEDVDDSVFDVVDDTVDITNDLDSIEKSELNGSSEEDLKQDSAMKAAEKAIGIDYSKWDKAQIELEKQQLMQLLGSHPDILKSYAYKYHMSTEDINILKDRLNDNNSLDLAKIFYDEDQEYKVLQGNLSGFYDDLEDR